VTVRADTHLDAALQYAERGIPLFPVWGIVQGRCACGRDCGRDAGKHPIGALVPRGFHDATTDAGRIRQWWRRYPEANLGTPTTWTAVVDIDPRHGGDHALEALEAQHGPLPETPEVLTGGGGRHLYFRSVPGLQNSAGLVAQGIDVRATGGYVLLPPSTHANGGVYQDEVSRPLFETPLAEMPVWLVARASAAPGATNGHRTAEDWAALLQGAPEGQRHAVLLTIAGHYLGRKIPAIEVEEILLGYAARCRPPHDPQDVRRVVRDLAANDAAKPMPESDASPAGWPLYDGSEPWEFPSIGELIESVLPLSGVVWWGGLPKRYKSLFALYCALAIACRRSGVARKFLIKAFPRILYVAREDGGPRLQARRDDILRAWTERPDPGAIVFCIRPRLDLLNLEHVAWLRDTCLKLGTTMVVLDTWTALSPSADPLGAKDQAALAAVVVKLAEDIAGLVIVVDHSRKNRPEGQPLSSSDIFGPPQKWAAAEHILMLDMVDAGRRIEVFIEGKDLETQRFFLTVSPQGSGEEKFTYAGSAEELAESQRKVGDQNRQAVLEILRANPDGLSTGELVGLFQAGGRGLSQDTVARHCQALGQAGLVRRLGKGKGTRFVAIPAAFPHPPSADQDGPAA
jgi:DNA-binding transcriptional ArsR family regulator